MMILLSASMILLMYFLAGINKIKNFKSTAMGLKSKLFNSKLPNIVYKLIILAVIILEIIAPLIILLSIQTHNYNDLAYFSSICLGLFTILATLLYHPLHKDYYGFMKNLTATGSLFLLSTYFR